MKNVLEHGFLISDHFLNSHQIEEINDEFEQYCSRQTTGTGGISGNLRHAEQKLHTVAKLVNSEKLINAARQYLPDPTQSANSTVHVVCIVRTIFFDKSTENNWAVNWHQDKTIAVSQRINLPGWGPWSCKEGIQHVQPPLDVLNNMITFRIHLDDTDQDNGCLKVIPKSHTLGIIEQKNIPAIIAQQQPFICAAASGSALIMRPHLLHASSKSNNDCRRRVLHIEFSSYTLPNGLNWINH